MRYAPDPGSSFRMRNRKIGIRHSDFVATGDVADIARPLLRRLGDRAPQIDADIGRRFAIRNPQSKIDNSQGGIAQLVERQLCKLEVRGSNPLASSLRSRRRGEQRPSRQNLGEGGLIGPCNVNAASYDSASRNTQGNVL